MKHTRNHDNAPNVGLDLVPVRFEFKHSTASTVCVAGSFNEWHPENKSLHPIGSGHWLRETNLPPGTYQYCLVVDGEWMPDPLAKETVPNPFGGRNSVLNVFPSAEAAHRADAVNQPMKNTTKQKPVKL